MYIKFYQLKRRKPLPELTSRLNSTQIGDRSIYKTLHNFTNKVRMLFMQPFYTKFDKFMIYCKKIYRLDSKLVLQKHD